MTTSKLTEQEIRPAELMAKQGGSIPVFLKQGVNRWLFHGRMRLVGCRTDLA